MLEPQNLNHFPVLGGMARYGLTPYGDPLYRIVFAPSRRYLVCGEWPDGSDCARWVVKHKNVGNVWIMERWLPAEQYARCTREQWDLNMLALGPWPERGEYELCHVFDVAPPQDCCIDTLITWIEAGRRIPFSETLVYQKKLNDAERKQKSDMADAMIRNRLPAFGGAPMVGRGGKRGSKTAKILKSAEELGLPTTPGLSSPRVAA